MSKTLKELKQMYESGEHVVDKRNRSHISKQLSRVCAQMRCHESIAFTSSKTIYCKKHNKQTATSVMRTVNKKKKLTYEKAHGIVRKRQIKKITSINSRSDAIEYDKAITLLYEDYKEPLREAKDALGYGFGYMGTVALTPDRDYVQCHICGNLYANLAGHIIAHKITQSDYKLTYGLEKKTILMGDTMRERRQQLVLAKNSTIANIKGSGKLPDHLKKWWEDKAKDPEFKRKTHTGMSLEMRNKKGLCPDQVLEKILDLKEILGKTPSSDEFSEHFKGRYIASIVYQHGSWVNAVKKLGLMTRDELRHPDSEQLLQDLRDFKETFNRIPMTSNFNRGLLRDKNVYIRQFGKLNNARVEAGMNAVMQVSRTRFKEVTPEDYFKYLDNHEDARSMTTSAIRARKRRKKIAEKKKLFEELK